MTIGEKIRSMRKEKGLTQKALGDLLGVTQATVGQYETNPKPPKIETLQRIAIALDVPLPYLMGEMRGQCPWDLSLDQKLSHIGYSVGYDDEDGDVWINFPDGTLAVTEDELKTLNESADSYLRFKLDELRTAHAEDFRPKR